MFLNALIILSDHIIHKSFEVLNYKFIEHFNVLLRCDVLSSNWRCEAIVEVETVCGVTVACEFLCHLSRQCSVGLGVEVGAET